MYVIHESASIPAEESYSGTAWEESRLDRSLYRKQYHDWDWACTLAYELQRQTGIRFKVSEAPIAQR